MKRVQWFAIGLGALLLGAAFLAGSVGTHQASAQAPSAPVAQRAAPVAAGGQQAAVAAPAQPVAYTGAAAAPTQQSVPVAPPPAVQPQDQMSAAAAAATPEPTEVAGTPEPVETVAPGATPEPTEVADQGETGGPDNEAADAAALAGQAHITQQQAEQAALAANPGTTVTKTDLGDENGKVVYDVELSNGSDVKVNGQTGAILGTDQAGSDGAETGGADQTEGDQGP